MSLSWLVLLLTCTAVLFAAALLQRRARLGRRRGAAKSAASAVVMPSREEQERRLAAFCSQPFRAECDVTASVAAGATRADGDMLLVQSREGCYVTVTVPVDDDAASAERSSNNNSSSSKRTTAMTTRAHTTTTTTTATHGGLTTTMTLLDLATYDFYSFATHPDIVDVAQQTVASYGVGSCGPRGFYGTIKPHLDLEHDLAAFLQTDEAVVYSLAYATVTTVVPCFASRGDYIVYDEAICSAVLEGCLLSRATMTAYAHNDMTSLQAALEAVVARDSSGKDCPHRRFVVTEGVFANTGVIAQLPRIVELCARYRFRLMLDDSYGFGVLGAHGRGTPDHFGLTVRDAVDVYMGSLSTALGGVGGFCAGSAVVCDHQRIAGSGYVFSASLPPYVTACASAVLAQLTRDASCVAALRTHAQHTRAALRAGHYDRSKIQLVDCIDDASPLLVLAVTPAYIAACAAADKASNNNNNSNAQDDKENNNAGAKDHDGDDDGSNKQRKQQLLQKQQQDGRMAVERQLKRVVAAVRQSRVAIQRHVYDTNEPVRNVPALRIVCKSRATEQEMHAATDAIVRALEAEFA